MPTAPQPSSPPLTRPDLVVVLPVYNEQEIIGQVVEEWLGMLDGLGIPFRLQVWNDGSTDDTESIVTALRHPGLEIQTVKNRGHGPTILRAYRSAAERAPWIFQCDSDGELPAAPFAEFWSKREEADLVTGIRTGREGPAIRKAVTLGSRLLIRLLFGGGPKDVNCPYRLMRSSAFFSLLDQLPEDTFAPNLLISGHAGRKRLRIVELPVPFSPRTTGVPSIRKWKLARAALRSAMQTFSFRFRTPPK